MYKNIDKQVSLKLKDQVEYSEGQIISKTDVPHAVFGEEQFKMLLVVSF